MPGTTEAITFTDSYKHMECLGGMMLQSFLMVTLFTRATPGTPASVNIKCLILLDGFAHREASLAVSFSFFYLRYR